MTEQYILNKEIYTLEELLEFTNKYGEIVFGKAYDNDEMNRIEIYDDYREQRWRDETTFIIYWYCFDVEMVNAVDYNSAKTNLLKAESDLLQSKYEYIFKTKILDFYKGEYRETN